MTAINEFFPDKVYHPGVTLNEKLQEMGMSRKEFALRAGKPEKTIIAVLKGTSSVTAEMAILFENITRIPAHFWINKQSRYNEYKARLQRQRAVQQAREWTKQFPYAQMAELGWVPKTRKIEEKSLYLLQYFGISSHQAWTKLYIDCPLKVAAFTSLKHTHDPHALSAWLRQGEFQAASRSTGEFDRKLLVRNLQEIKTIMATHPDNFFARVKQLCLNAGVKIFCTPKLPRVPISGSTRWIRNTPVIQFTARYKQNDRFWFTFFHEIGHILLHGKKYISLEGIDFSETDPEKEQKAHDFAEEWTFSKKQEKELLAYHHIDESLVIEFAQKYNTHPALIIGRLQHKNLIPYSVGRQLIQPIDLSDQ